MEDKSKSQDIQRAVDADSQTSARSTQGRKDLMESSIMKTYAAGIPSHRHAWPVTRRFGGLGPSGSSTNVRRSANRSTDRSEDEADDDDIAGGQHESKVSAFATSVPVFINMPQMALGRASRGRAELPAMEQKTSLRDRGSVLVPSLLAAMRERGLATPDSGTSGQLNNNNAGPSTFGQRRDSRSVSGNRDRERVKQFQADPGAAFESMADDVADERDDGESGPGGAGGADDGEDSGTLRDSRTFIPPHVLARKESLNSNDVGWRSMVNE